MVGEPTTYPKAWSDAFPEVALTHDAAGIRTRDQDRAGDRADAARERDRSGRDGARPGLDPAGNARERGRRALGTAGCTTTAPVSTAARSSSRTASRSVWPGQPLTSLCSDPYPLACLLVFVSTDSYHSALPYIPTICAACGLAHTSANVCVNNSMNVPGSQELIAGLLALAYNASSLRQHGTFLLYVGSFFARPGEKRPTKDKKSMVRICCSALMLGASHI